MKHLNSVEAPILTIFLHLFRGKVERFSRISITGKPVSDEDEMQLTDEEVAHVAEFPSANVSANL